MKKMLLKVLRNFKERGIALTLVLSVLFSTVLPSMGGVGKVFAAGTELIPENLPQKGEDGSTTMWKVMYSSGTCIDFKGKTSNTTTWSGGIRWAFSTERGLPWYAHVTDTPITQTPKESDCTYNSTTKRWVSSLGAIPSGYSQVQFKDASGSADKGSDPDTPDYNKGVNGGVADLGNNVEAKFKVSTSSDKQYALIDLYLYNKGSSIKYLTFRMSGDTDLAGNDYVRNVLIPSDGTVHSVDDNTHSSRTMNSFDIINKDDGTLGLTPFDIIVTGYYGSMASRDIAYGYYINEPQVDSGVSLGWANIKMRPNEEVHKRVAVQCRTKTYYVNSVHGHDSGDAGYGNRTNPAVTAGGDGETVVPGSFDNPFRTVGYAIQAIGNQKANIYIQDAGVDIFEKSDGTKQDINITNAAQQITIATADLNFDNQIVANRSKISNKLSLNASNDHKINVSAGSLEFANIKLNGVGNRTDALINQTGGQVLLSTGAEFTGFNNPNGHAFINETGGTLTMSGASVKNCVSKEGFYAINPVANIDMSGVVTIKNNTNTAGNNANLYLPDGVYVDVTEKLKNDNLGTHADISVSTEKDPKVNSGSIDATDAEQEVIMAKLNTTKYPDASGISTCPFTSYFTHDKKGTSDDKGYKIDAGKTNGNAKNVAISITGTKVNFAFKNENGGAIAGASRDMKAYPAGVETFIASPSSATLSPETIAALNGYEFDYAEVAAPLVADPEGNVTGIMPQISSVLITYHYKAKESKIMFETRGGSPASIASLHGKSGKPVYGVLSTLSKYSYKFAGWYDVNTPYDRTVLDPSEWPVAKISGLPATYALNDITYYARYYVDREVFNDISEIHTNAGGSITLGKSGEGTLPAGIRRNAEDTFTYSKQNIPGYIWNQASSTVTPATYDYGDGIEAVGTFAGTGAFNGKTPGATTLVTYKYDVDSAQTFTFKAEYKKANGSAMFISGQDHSEMTKHAEDTVNFTPPTRTGYAVTNAEIIEGATAVPNEFRYAVTGSFAGESSSYAFSGNMPNQDVVVRYTYTPTGTGNELVVDYKDKGTADTELLGNIISSDITEHGLEETIIATPAEIYGYDCDYSVATNRTFTPETYDYGSGPESVGSFDAVGKFTGKQIGGSVTVTYNYDRVDAYFKPLYYKLYDMATISDCTMTFTYPDHSPDLLNKASDSANTESLITTASGTGWTFGKLKARRLVPNVSLTDSVYYKADRFFIDRNKNQIFDGTDTMITDDYEFVEADTGDNTYIVPYLEEVPDKWVDISFACESQGTIDATNMQTHWRDNTTWQLVSGTFATNMVITPNVGFVEDAWYNADSIKMENAMLATNGAIYTLKFKRDSNIFGGLKKVKAIASLDSQGRALLSIRDAKTYPVVLTDVNGVIMSTLAPSTTGSLAFNYASGIEINKSYKLYEVNETMANIDTYSNISEVDASKKSQEAVYLMPVVTKNNYQVSIDRSSLPNTNIATVTLKPTSPDYEYALYLSGNTPSGYQTGNVNGISFANLEVGKTYYVATKKGGVETTGTGNAVYVDDANVSTKTYTVVVMNGTVDGATSKAVAPGETVSIVANAGSFEKWECLYGSASFASVTLESTTFAMPSSNVVVMAKNTNPVPNLKLSSAQLGINDYKIVFDKSNEETLINALKDNTGGLSAEEYLVANGFDIEYRVVYEANSLTLGEEALLGDGYRGAVAIDVDIDRYIDGMRVDDPNYTTPPATPPLMGCASPFAQGLFGSALFDKVPGLEEYVNSVENGETVAPVAETEETTTIETEAEEDESESVAETEETSETAESEIETTETTETAETVETEETTETAETAETIESVETTEKETETVELESETVEETEPEEDPEGDVEISSFTDTDEDFDMEALYNNLCIFGSTFPSSVDSLPLNTAVVLKDADINMGEYKIYDVTTGSLSPVTIEYTDTEAKAGIVYFKALKGHRYIVSYKQYNDVTIICDYAGSEEMISVPAKKVVRVEYNTTIPAGDLPLTPLPNYMYNHVEYTNGVWSYVSGDRTNVFDASSPILMPTNIYAVYDNNAGEMLDVGSLLDKANDVLKDRFILNEEIDLINARMNNLQTVMNNPSASVTQMNEAYNALNEVVTVVASAIVEREIQYNKETDKKPESSIKTNTGSFASGAGGGGGGGGGAGGGGGGGGAAKKDNGLSPLSQANSVPVAPRGNDILVSSSTSTWVKNNDGSWSLSINGATMANGGFTTVYSTDAAGNITNATVYYFDPQGKMATGWVTDTNGDKYFFNNDNGNLSGVMCIGWKQVGNAWHYFGLDGKMYKEKITPDGFMIGADGKWVE